MIKKIMRIFLIFGLMISNGIPVLAVENSKVITKENYSANDAYSYIVSAKTGQVVTATSTGDVTAIDAETDGNQLDSSALFTIKQATNINRVQIIRSDNPNQVLVSSAIGLKSNGTLQANLNPGSWEGFEIDVLDEEQGLVQIKDYDGRYLSLEGNHLTLISEDDQETTSFYIISPKYDDLTVYIRHKLSGNYINVDGKNGQPVRVAGVEEAGRIGDDLRFTPIYGTFQDKAVMNFVSKEFSNIAWKSGGGDKVVQHAEIKAGGWESISVAPNGDGTISFKDSQNDQYVTVIDQQLICNFKGPLTDNEKFEIVTVTQPKKVSGLKVKRTTDTSIELQWNAVSDTIYSGYVVVATNQETFEQIISPETAKNELTVTGLSAGTSYELSVRTVNGSSPYIESDGLNVQTKNGVTPAKPEQLQVTISDGKLAINWEPVNGATSYTIYRGRSAYDQEGYQKIAEKQMGTTFIDEQPNPEKYENYYRIAAENENGLSNQSDQFVSLETELFGKNMLIFSPYDEVTKIDEIVKNVFSIQNDITQDAQFNENRFGIYFKPGDYIKTKTMPVGFYTHIGGLGKTPYDVKLNNLEVPAYLGDFNATCNFWRSVENFSVMKTGDNTSYFGGWRGEQFNWGIAQAAPMRRIYSQRAVSYDWNYGWASGGYVADSRIEGKDNDGNGSGTHSGQQFYTRNSEVTSNVYGTTLNAFYQGVIAPNLPTSASENASALINKNGFTNWGIPTKENTAQVMTSISTTPKIREKPFLFLDDDGEYKIFVPALKTETKGTSWDKENMGDGKALSIDKFYIAKEEDSAKTINRQLADGKNIFFTPGVYHAEEVIQVKQDNTILLGTGMASIIPDNPQGAMSVADVSGVTVAGIIFDAGAGSENLLIVGEQKTTKRHADNPTLLADLFFRIGGTTGSLTKADNAIIINSNDVIGDHFWIWRADHGAGVAWDGNVSEHGLIVNGDHVTSYALFNEHFQKYDTLWNGDYGSTYFYQNEKAYDPISQDAWMSDNGKTKGYAAYKVANNVENHYAVGLGIYNVFIYTGPTYDASKVQIEMDNAIEVPNKKNVLVENATIQTFAKDDGALQKFNHIINGLGEGVSSGVDVNTGEKGEGWSRKFMLSYQNGKGIRGFNGSIVEEAKQQPGDSEPVSVSKKVLEELYNKYKNQKQGKNTEASWQAFQKALTTSQTILASDTANQALVDQTIKELQTAVSGLKENSVPVTVLGDKKALEELYNKYKNQKQGKNTEASWQAFEKALTASQTVLASETADQALIDQTIKELQAAILKLEEVETQKKPVENKTSESFQPVSQGGGKISQNKSQNKVQPRGKLPATGETVTQQFMFLGGLVMIVAVGGFILKKRTHKRE